MYEQYVAAFNAGDVEAYARFYAPGVRFRNGAGIQLVGPTAIVEYYEALKGAFSRVMTVKAMVQGEQAFAAALESRFVILADGVAFGGDVLDTGDAVHLESMALYEVEDGRFTSIDASTLNRRIERLGERNP